MINKVKKGLLAAATASVVLIHWSHQYCANPGSVVAVGAMLVGVGVGVVELLPVAPGATAPAPLGFDEGRGWAATEDADAAAAAAEADDTWAATSAEVMEVGEW